MTAIYKRELRSYFNSMIGYVFIAAVMVVIGIYFMVMNLKVGYPYFATALAGTGTVFAFTVPILTMKSMAEERRSKSDQMLLTYPVSVSGIVLGKFFAMLTVFAIPLLISCLCPLAIVRAGGSGSYLIDYSTILLFLFMGGLFISIGMFISSLTESPVIAAVVSMIALLLLLLWTSLVGFIPATVTASVIGFLILFALIAFGLSRSLGSPVIGIIIFGMGVLFTVLCAILASTWFSSALTYFLMLFDIYSPISNFTTYYLFDVKGLIFYVVFAALFVFLTVQSVQKRRYR